MRFRDRGYHGVGSGWRADYEASIGGKEARGAKQWIGEPDVLSRIRKLGEPAVLRGRSARPLGDVPEEQNGNFMQVLEGDEEAVRGLYERIAEDPRHGGEITLQEGFVEERQFPDWSMGFRDLDSPEARADPAYNEYLNAPLTGREFSGQPSRAQKLLLTFKRTM